MSNELPHPPEKIWLQWHGDGDPSKGDPLPTAEVTWNANKVWRGDVCYVRADHIDQMRELIAVGQKMRDDLRQPDDDKGLAAWWDSLLPNAKVSRPHGSEAQ